jgi:hypothetical protein
MVIRGVAVVGVKRRHEEIEVQQARSKINSSSA